MTRLRRLGYRIAVDDLGAGYSGLSSFSQLEPDLVKLDCRWYAERDALERLGADLLQGYLFAKPEPHLSQLQYFSARAQRRLTSKLLPLPGRAPAE
jgi:EAL domain-containing protein (putative c-di-GMP-specific phosphodiesterase class I)